jgi:FHS family L-fucose permease-like MFS transporter
MATATQYSEVSAPETSESYARPLAIVTTLFFMWGFLTCLNDILIPHIKSAFDLSYTKVLLIQFAFFAAYLLFAIPAARLVDWIGYLRTMVTGLFTASIGAFLFVPAASLRSYALFLTAQVVLAVGITMLQVSAIPYVIVLGRNKTASSRLTLAQGFASLGTAIAPAFGALVILGAAPVTAFELRNMSPDALQYYHIAQAASVKLPYILIGAMLILLTAVIGSVRLPDVVSAERRSFTVIADKLWKHPNLIFGCIGIFVCVGAEVSIGGLLVNYLSRPDIGHLTERAAVGFVSFYWFGAIAGRFVGAALLRKIRTGVLLAVCAAGATVLVATSMLTHGPVAMWSILGVSLFSSIMFPSIFTLGVAELGPLTADGSGVMIMSMVGGAIIPLLQGLLADHIGIQRAFLVPAICFLYILFFAVKGSQPNSERVSAV